MLVRLLALLFGVLGFILLSMTASQHCNRRIRVAAAGSVMPSRLE
jgi:hypothetical protein